jgi:phosphoribosylaminoimidazole carboxylase PurE protein
MPRHRNEPEPRGRNHRGPRPVAAPRTRRGAAPRVVFFIGSDSDLPAVEPALAVLDRFGVTNELRIASAHRTPEAVRTLVAQYEAGGTRIFVCAAGMAAHLAGAVAALTTRPVLGIPLASGPLSGFDALLSTVQMPPGVPVGTVAVGPAGALNAAYLSCRILALEDDDLASRLLVHRSETAAEIARKDEKRRQPGGEPIP